MPDSLMPPNNRLLAALPHDVQGRLAPDLKPIYLRQGTVLHDYGQTPCTVYFPADAIVSLSCLTENGACAEVSQVGSEGLVGIAALMPGDSRSTVATVQAAGHAYALGAQRLRDELAQNPAMLLTMLRYTQSLILQMAQMAVCNRHHSIDQQLCRWLLRFDDHLPGQRLIVTHEQIANMLGVRREGITRATRKLNQLGTIRCGRNEITVLDRSRLEHLSCECYEVVRQETERLLPQPAGLGHWQRQSPPIPWAALPARLSPTRTAAAGTGREYRPDQAASSR